MTTNIDITVLGWVLSLGIQLGLFWSLKSEVARIRQRLDEATLTRSESDAVHAELRARIEVNGATIEDLRSRIRLLETHDGVT